MNWDQIEGKWKQFTGSARERWGKLTDNDWETIAGKKDQLVGRIQERYGLAKEEAEKQADEWSRALANPSAQATPPPASRNRPPGQGMWIDETAPSANRGSLVQVDAPRVNVALPRRVPVPDVRAAASGVLGAAFTL